MLLRTSYKLSNTMIGRGVPSGLLLDQQLYTYLHTSLHSYSLFTQALVSHCSTPDTCHTIQPILSVNMISMWCMSLSPLPLPVTQCAAVVAACHTELYHHVVFTLL